MNRRLVEAVGSNEPIEQPVIETAERKRRQSQFRSRQHGVLDDMSGLEQREPVAAQAVLDARSGEDGGHDHESGGLVKHSRVDEGRPDVRP